MSPNIYEGGTSMVMSPPIFQKWSFRMSTRVTATVVCCILCKYVQFQKKSFRFLGTSPRPSTGAPLLNPTGGLPSARPPVFFFMSPNNPVKSTPFELTYVNKIAACTRQQLIVCISATTMTRTRVGLHCSQKQKKLDDLYSALHYASIRYCIANQ